MHGKNSKVAIATLSALLYAEALLVAAGVVHAATKDRSGVLAPQPPLVASAASSDAQVR